MWSHSAYAICRMHLLSKNYFHSDGTLWGDCCVLCVHGDVGLSMLDCCCPPAAPEVPSKTLGKGLHGSGIMRSSSTRASKCQLSQISMHLLSCTHSDAHNEQGTHPGVLHLSCGHAHCPGHRVAAAPLNELHAFSKPSSEQG